MRQELIDEFAGYFLESAQIADPMEARMPLYKADALFKTFEKDEVEEACRKAPLLLLQDGQIDFAVYFVEDLFPETRAMDNPEIQELARKKYKDATDRQMESAEDIMESAEDIKRVFKL